MLFLYFVGIDSKSLYTVGQHTSNKDIPIHNYIILLTRGKNIRTGKVRVLLLPVSNV